MKNVTVSIVKINAEEVLKVERDFESITIRTERYFKDLKVKKTIRGCKNFTELVNMPGRQETRILRIRITGQP